MISNDRDGTYQKRLYKSSSHLIGFVYRSTHAHRYTCRGNTQGEFWSKGGISAMLSQVIKEMYHNVYLYKLHIIEAEVNTGQWINITIIIDIID